MDPLQPEPVTYLCGDCGEENTLKPGDVVQCRKCGHRILHKKRTRRSIYAIPSPVRAKSTILKGQVICLSGLCVKRELL
ncbi:hypothetical protein ZIOFF_000293 [Zingiber officinale]|uniref:DNA-directed RNA polymerase n=1 Tax=Zingiber officinale TaxID=94328 RepID=A0A8J5IJG7_ZINOF|nr:hypothetical protein ZIOFF_000293 [Zingiber officinale]